MKRALWVFLVLILCFSIAVSSCNKKTTSTTTTPATTSASPSVAEPQLGGTLTVMGYGGVLDPYAWDPADCDWFQAYVSNPYGETLLIGDINKGPRGTKEFTYQHPEWIPDSALTGNLAQTWEIPNPTTILFHIRPGVMFTGRTGVMSAREFTAYDAEYCFARLMASPKLAAGRYGFVDSIKATDKYTLTVTTNKFAADWTYKLGWGPYIEMYPQEVVTAGISDPMHSVGTGPFILSSYVSGASITYDKNPNYWGSTTINGKKYQMPLIDKLELPIITDEATAVASFLTGKLDIYMAAPLKFKSQIEKQHPELMKWTVPNQTCNIVSLRVDKPPFDNRNVRLAMSLAIDRTALINSALWGGSGDILNYPFGSTYPSTLYTPLNQLPAQDQEIFTYNPTKAIQLLKDAGFPNGIETNMIIDGSTSPDDAEISAQLAGFWAKIGVKVELRPMEYSAYQSMFQSQKQDALVFINKGLVAPVTAMNYQREGNVWGVSNWRTTDYIALLDKAVATSDTVEREKMLKQLNVMVIDSIAYISLPSQNYYRYAYPWVKNYYGEMAVGYWCNATPLYSSMWIDQTARNKVIVK